MSSRKLTDPVSTILGVPERLRTLRGALSQAAFAKRLGMKAPQWNRYEKGQRLPDPKVLERVEALTGKSIYWILTGRQPSEPVPMQFQLWLDKEWQATHSFTALVEALRELEVIEPTNHLHAWLTRLAWEAVLAAADIVLKVHGKWSEANWKEIYDRRLDHWLRPKFGRRSERETLSQWLQVELGFPQEETTKET
jgi:transcriptional regulator with XRE-family HTH domain